jgi:ABC-2 type transport system ATP-binding protein
VEHAARRQRCVLPHDVETRHPREGKLSEGLVAFHVAGAEEFAPRLITELRTPTRSIRIARPTLDDVFMAYTGRTIRDAEASTAERFRSRPMARARRGR